MNANPHEVLQWLVSWRQLFDVLSRRARTSPAPYQQMEDASEPGASA